MKSRCFIIYAPLGIAEAYMWFQGVDGVHVIRFTSYECSGFYVGLEDFDYPVDREEFLIEKEFLNRKRSWLIPTEYPFPRLCGFTDYYNPTRPGHLRGGPCLLGRFSSSTLLSVIDLMGCPCSQRTVPIGPPIVLFSPLFLVLCALTEIPSQNCWGPLLRAVGGPGARASPSNLCYWACNGKHLLLDCNQSPVPAGTCNLTSHVLVILSNLHSYPASGATTLKCASVPQVDGPPKSPALHGDTGENESDQDIMITG